MANEPQGIANMLFVIPSILYMHCNDSKSEINSSSDRGQPDNKEAVSACAPDLSVLPPVCLPSIVRCVNRSAIEAMGPSRISIPVIQRAFGQWGQV